MVFLKFSEPKLQLTKFFAKLGTMTKISKNIQEETITILKQKKSIFTNNCN